MMKWDPTLREFSKTRLEPENEFGKFAVAVKKLVYSQKLFLFFRGSNLNSYKGAFTGKRVSLGDEEGFQIPCKLHFTE